ncbi:MAG: V-type ATP synthase subunit D [Candidatus Altiarchaeales archaeon]|nr:V-type ATP synthase subunit D [Candidatus Altiarchaeales archaeon]MBD3415834.1 V-type ATP synthase subunit D [Candidatus Altiarchaeales archaeon]
MAEDIVEGTHPTRMELLQIKDKLRLARKGHRLLKEKRDTLMMEFMNLSKEAGDVGEMASDQMKAARHALAVSSSLAGPSHIESASLSVEGGLAAEVEYRNVMGIQLPKISLEERLNAIDDRGYGLITTHPSVDLLASEYERAVDRMIELAAAEQSLIALSSEVKKTNRRVNALEYRVVPRLENTQKYISMRLDEREREGFYRNKMVKRKRGL